MSYGGWDNRFRKPNYFNPFNEAQRNSTYSDGINQYYGPHPPIYRQQGHRQHDMRKVHSYYPRRHEEISPNGKDKSDKATDNIDLDQVKPSDSIHISTITFSVTGNVLSIEDAVKLSNSANKRKNSSSEEGVPNKKPKIGDTNINSDKKDTSDVSNPQMTKLQTYDGDVAAMKSKIKVQLKIVRELKEKFDRENDILKEMKIKKNSLLRKVKKICKVLAAEDNDEDDRSDNEVVIGAPNEIIDLESSSSDSVPTAIKSGPADGSNSDSDSDSSGSVEFIAKTITTATTTPKIGSTKPHLLPTPLLASTPLAVGPAKVKSDHPSPIKIAPRPVDASAPAPALPTVLVCAKKPTTSTVPLSPAPLIVSGSLLVTDTPAVPPVITLPTEPLPEQSGVKTELHKSQKDKPFVLTVPNGEFDVRDSKVIKADAENGLFNAIEPKLSTIVVSEIDKTYVTDIKIFNNRLFVSASYGLLKQYDLRSHDCLMDYPGHKDLIHCILPTAHPVGVKRLISGGFDQNVLIHNVDTGAVLHKIETDRPILSMCDLMEYVYIGNGGGDIMIFSLEKDRKMSNFRASESGISCLSATREASRQLLFVGSNDGEYCIWDAITFVKMKVITPLAHIEAPIGFVMLQKQRVLAFTKNHVHFIYYAKPRNPTSLNHFSSINSMCLTKNYAIVGGNTGKLSVYRLKGSVILKNPIKSLDNSASPIISLTFYNNTIITGNKNGRIYFNRLVES